MTYDPADPKWFICARCGRPTVLGICSICVFRREIEDVSIHLSVRGQPIKEPISGDILKTTRKINVVVGVTLSELLDLDTHIKDFNDLMTEKILGDFPELHDTYAVLEDIRYSVVGHKAEKSDSTVSSVVYIWVRAELARY